MDRRPRGRLSLRRIALLILALGLLLALGMAWLVGRSFRSAAQEEALRHKLVAERLFDELERELTTLVEREEARSFLEYRYFYVPERQVPGSAALVRSPLSEMAADPMVLGYFQLDPDGTLHTPIKPRHNEQQLAQANYDWQEDPQVEQAERSLADLVAQADWQPAQVTAEEEPPQLAQAQPVQQKRESLYQSLNRAVFSRSSRQPQSVTTQVDNLRGFSNDEEDIQQLMVQQQAAAPEELAAPPPPQQEAAQPRSAASGEVDVEISPLQGLPIDGEHLLLHRELRIGGDSYRQGLALSLPQLGAHLEQAVLAPSALAPYVDLAWNGSSAKRKKYSFDHRFAEPFGGLAVRASLGRIPGEVVAGRGTVLVLAALLGLLGCLGALALYRMVAAEVAFAQRRNDFVAAVSHELKTPLTAIRLLGEMLRDGMVPAPERRQQYFETITAEAERLSRLIENVLALARLERGNYAQRPVVGQVGDVLQQLPEILGPHLREQGFALELDIAPDLPPVTMDRDALLQVLVNLLDNALKFARTAQEKRVVVRARPAGEGVALLVRDHGPGVPNRQLRRVFQPFFRGERELTRKTKGTGIGLSLVRGLVERMGGRVSARNHPQGGFEVRVLLVGEGA